MKKYVLVDLIIFLAACSTFLLLPLRNEYIYKRVSEQHNFTKSNNTYCIANDSKDSKADAKIVADEASKWTMYIDLAIFVPAIVVGALFNSWSDRVGRKITLAIPLLGSAVGSAIQALIIFYKWPLATMFAYSLTTGCTGYYMCCLMQGMAYLSDVTEVEERGQRFTILETFIGIGAGAAGLAGGFWTKATGFLQPVLFTIGLNILAFILVFFLPNALMSKLKLRRVNKLNSHDDKTCASSDDSNHECNEKSSLIQNYNNKSDKLYKAVWRVYSTDNCHCPICYHKNQLFEDGDTRCMHGGGYIEGKAWRMWLYLMSYSVYMFVTVGIIVFQTIFYLAYPLCFTTAMVGIQLAIKFGSTIFSPFILIGMKKLSLSNNACILISVGAFLLFPLLVSFAKDPWLVYLGTATMALGSLAKPLIQGQMSGMASEFEQGAMFALLSSIEVFSFLVATVAYLLMYPATQNISHWFCWIFSAAILVIPLILISVIWVADKRKQNKQEKIRG